MQLTCHAKLLARRLAGIKQFIGLAQGGVGVGKSELAIFRDRAIFRANGSRERVASEMLERRGIESEDRKHDERRPLRQRRHMRQPAYLHSDDSDNRSERMPTGTFRSLLRDPLVDYLQRRFYRCVSLLSGHMKERSVTAVTADAVRGAADEVTGYLGHASPAPGGSDGRFNLWICLIQAAAG